MSENRHTSRPGAPGRVPHAGGPMGMMLRGEKAKDFSGAVKKLTGYLSQYKLIIIFVWVIAIISTVLSIFGPKVLAEATDVLFDGFKLQISGAGAIDFTKIGEILCM